MESASGLPEHALLSLLRKRHASGEPYAWLDHDCLLSVNPGRPLPSLYGRSRVAATCGTATTWCPPTERTVRTACRMPPGGSAYFGWSGVLNDSAPQRRGLIRTLPNQVWYGKMAFVLRFKSSQSPRCPTCFNKATTVNC